MQKVNKRTPVKTRTKQNDKKGKQVAITIKLRVKTRTKQNDKKGPVFSQVLGVP